MIATNAKSIVKARMQGFRPDELILISLVGRISERNHTVLADPGQVYDWRWVRDLDICVYIDGACDWRAAMLTIRKAMPRIMWVWDVDSQRGASVFLKPSHPASEPKPARSWDWVLDFTSWFDCQNEAYKCS
jgi:hypothetical protein